MFLADTNILIYAVHRGAPEQEACRQLLDRWRRDPLPWAITWPILYEFLRVATHPRVFAQPLSVEQAWRFAEALLSSASLQVLVPGERHADVAQLTFDEMPDLRGNLLHDAHTAVLMREHGISIIYTRDTDFHRFRFLEVIDPVAGAV